MVILVFWITGLGRFSFAMAFVQKEDIFYSQYDHSILLVSKKCILQGKKSSTTAVLNFMSLVGFFFVFVCLFVFVFCFCICFLYLFFFFFALFCFLVSYFMFYFILL